MVIYDPYENMKYFTNSYGLNKRFVYNFNSYAPMNSGYLKNTFQYQQYPLMWGRAQSFAGAYPGYAFAYSSAYPRSVFNNQNYFNYYNGTNLNKNQNTFNFSYASAISSSFNLSSPKNKPVTSPAETPESAETTKPAEEPTSLKPTLPPAQLEILKESRGEWGDPHFDLKGFSGNDINFDHKGVDYHTYNIFNGDNLKIDGLYGSYKNSNNPQVIDNLRINTGSDSILYNKDGSALLNDKFLAQGITSLKDGSKLNYDKKNLVVHSNENDALVKIIAENAGITVDPEGKFSNLGGIIGKALIDNKPLTSTECNAFDITTTNPI